MFSVVQGALVKHPNLKKVILMKHSPRYDLPHVDQRQLKAKLANFANDTFAQLWQSSGMKDKIIVADHNLQCSEDEIDSLYTDENTGRYDGVHM